MFQKCKRLTALLLSVVMLVALVAVAPVHASTGSGENHTHNFSTRGSATMYYCQFGGDAVVTYDECSCGARRFVIARATDAGATTTSGKCSLITVETDSECPSHKNQYSYCTVCHLYYGLGTEGRHVYTATETVEPTCTVYWPKKRRIPSLAKRL